MATVATMGANKHVLSGLEITCEGLQVKVSRGRCEVDGKEVVVASDTALAVDPVPIISVQDEAVKLKSEEPKGWAHGPRLKGVQPRPGWTPLPGCLAPNSVVVKSAPGDKGAPFKEGEDYLVDHAWGQVGRKPTGKIGEKDTVYIDYKCGVVRIDTIFVSPDGKVTLQKGVEAKTCPFPPERPVNCLALANVFMPYHATSVGPEQIYPVGDPVPAPTPEELKRKAQLVKKTRAKLEAGEPVTIVAWGDSVTSGGDASVPAKNYVNLFASTLQAKYPKAKITMFNAGIGGSNTNQRLPNLQKEVLDHKPDLVVIEYVNDMGMTPENLRKNYFTAIDQIRAAGAEVIIQTPHFTMLTMMGGKSLRDPDGRRNCEGLRQIALEKSVGLSDAAKRWEHLWREGLPYITFLYNGINHPDDRGHKLFVDELMKFF
jgi:lysophospholipase L1-like esterase